MHGTSLAECIAAGFLSAGIEEHSAPGAQGPRGIGLWLVGRLPVSSAQIEVARGEIDYGIVVIVELGDEAEACIQRADGGEIRSTGPIPLAFVRRVLFRTEGERKEFVARSSGYDDVPKGILDLAIDPDAFPASGQPGFGLAPDSPGPSASSQAPAAPSLDKIAGSIAAVLAALRCLPDVPAAAAADNMFGGKPPVTSTGDIARAAVAFLDPVAATDRSGSATLAVAAASILGAMHPRNGFDAGAFLKEIAASASGGSSKEAAAVGSFVKHASDVVQVRRELSPDSFGDSAGKIVPRALLLFVLNPDPDRLLAIPSQIPILGDSVFLLASVFAGSYAGLTSLPAPVKAPDKSAFLGVGLLAFDLLAGNASPLEERRQWDSSGRCRIGLSYGNFRIAVQETEANPLLGKAHALLKRLGLEPEFDQESGALSALARAGEPLRRITCRVAMSPSLPRESSLTLVLSIDFGTSKKEAISMASMISVSSLSTGVFAAVAPGKARRVDLSAVCLERAMTEEGLSEAMRLLCDQSMQFLQNPQ